ncbi:MAG: hypothetical protein RBR71_13305 [Gudongella sp.]|jgi:hypothetical protein|nr:hypothetical protein [Gudongella sp.]
MTRVMMACGHMANTAHRTGGRLAPICAICGCSEVVDAPVLPEGREAKCSYCGRTRSSSIRLPFFQSRPDMPFDRYYCGCLGWE